MKKIKTILITMLLIAASSNVDAQDNLSISLHQDIKFAVVGDLDRGYKAGTIDIVARFKMNGQQRKVGFMSVFPEFEYANIKGLYHRYSANVGYTFNRLPINKLELAMSLGYGWIDRNQISTFSFSFNSAINYKLTKNLKLSLLGQLTQRSDLKYLYNDNVYKPSVFIGLEYAMPFLK